MHLVRITFSLLSVVVLIATVFVAASKEANNFLLLLMSLGVAVVWTIPDIAGAFTPERFIDEREAERRAAGDMQRIYRLMSEIAATVLLVVGIVFYRDGVRF
ncbi:MAG: hypothetical protein QM698_09825 [Micropepsaceae bacterium]